MIIATVLQCNSCTKVTIVRSEEEWNEFDSTWLNLINEQFCPDCKNSDQAKDAKRDEEIWIAENAQLAIGTLAGAAQ